MLQRCLHAALDFFYPPLCLHCQNRAEDRRHLLCSTCLEHLVLAELEWRCPYCFKPVEGRPVCSSCAASSVLYKRLATACEKEGPARTLLQHYQQGSLSLAPALGALMAMQWMQLDWPMPDSIIPLSQTLLPWKAPGRDRNLLLAREVGKILGCSTHKGLQRVIDPSFLRDETQEMGFRFLKKKRFSFADQKLLLIAETSEKELVRAAAATLQEGFPLEIRVLCFV